jgi:hypothetical protein
MQTEQWSHSRKVASLGTVQSSIPGAFVIFYSYLYFSFLFSLSLFRHFRSVLFRPSSRKSWIKKLALHSFAQDEAGRKRQRQRQRPSTCFLIIFPLAVMMQTPGASIT